MNWRMRLSRGPAQMPRAAPDAGIARVGPSNQVLQRAHARLDPAIAATAHRGSPSTWITPPAQAAEAPHEPVAVHDTPAAHRAAAHMGVAGFSHRGAVFLGDGLDGPGAPGRSRVLAHEIVHALQARQDGPPAGREALERQAHAPLGAPGLLAADPEAVHGWLWIPAIIAFGYIMTRSNTANAPGPGDKTYPSLTTGDYAKMVAEASLLASGGLIAGSIRRAGYSMVTAWGGSGAIGSMGFRAIGDVSRGEFSGAGAYVIDGLTGAVVGIVVGGTFHAVGQMPSLARLRNWYNTGAETDAAWAQLSPRNKLLYEIGQKTLPAGQWEPLANMTPVARGQEIVSQQGWLRSLFPSSGKFAVPGAGGTLSTGPTPAFRHYMPRFFGMAAGAAGRHGLYPDWEDNFFGPDAPLPSTSPQSSLILPMNDQNTPPAEGGAITVPPGWDTIIVVPEGREMEYLIKSGQVGDFPIPDTPPDTALG